MIIFPAIDIQGGKAVRLQQGRKQDVTVFADSPVEVALHWQVLGAEWLHIVDLDGAFAGSRISAPIVGEITRQCSLPVQVGGGIRTLEDARLYLDLGVKRLIIGTSALEDPATFRILCESFPGQIGVSLDARDGALQSRGWVHDTGRSVEEALPEIISNGASFVIYTDIMRDGMRSGVNLAALQRLLNSCPVPVVVAGGVANLDDVRALANLAHSGILEGFISGRALYEKSLDFAEALNFLAAAKA